MRSLEVGSPVLLVGEMGPRLEPDFKRAGLMCTMAQTAGEAVARLKSMNFPLVVVPPVLVDMGGTEFVHGVLRHFEASVLLCGNGVDAVELSALVNSGRVTHVPGGVDGRQIVDYVMRDSMAPVAAGRPLDARDAMPVVGGALNGNTPSPYGRTSSLPPGMAPGLHGAHTGSYPPSPPGGAVPPPYMPQYGAGYGTPAAAYPVPQTQPPGPMPAYGSNPPQAYEDPRMVQQRAQAMADELGRANSELVSLRSSVRALQAEKTALSEELEASRTDAGARKLELEALREELATMRTQASEAAARVEAAQAELNNQRESVASARRAQDDARAELQETRMRLDEVQEQHQAIVAERDTLRTEAGPLREWTNELVAENARQLGELERQRKILEELGYEEQEEKTTPIQAVR